MGRETQTTVDQGSLLTEQQLNKEEYLDSLLKGESSKNVILRPGVSTLSKDPFLQRTFLLTMIKNIGREGEGEISKRRSRTMAILIESDNEIQLSKSIIPLVCAREPIVYFSYIQEVRQQTNANDPLSGSIAALLDLGKAIAPYLPIYRSEQIIIVWEKVAQQFSDAYKRAVIHEKLTDIINSMSKNVISENTTKKKPSKEAIADREDIVEQLRNQDLNNRQIAEYLNINTSPVNVSSRRLIYSRKIKPLPSGSRAKREAAKERDLKVQQKIEKGITIISQIAQQIDEKPGRVWHSIQRLIKAGKITKLKK